MVFFCSEFTTQAGDYMLNNIIGAVIAAIAGFLIAFVNYTFSKKVLIKAPEKFIMSTMARQVIQVLFLVLVYFIGTKTEIASVTYLLVGAVAGMTIPMIFFTKKLLSFNKTTDAKKSEKEVESDG